MYKRIALIVLLIFAISFLYYQIGESASKKSDKKKSSQWLTDFDKAKKESKKNSNPIFILFTGSDWCSWCKKLNSEILVKKTFKKYAKENLILLKIDFPVRTKLPDKVMRQNFSLKRTYGIRGYPTVMITDSKGKPMGQMSYMKGGPKVFIKELKRILSQKKKK